jgi:hypothetical protein
MSVLVDENIPRMTVDALHALGHDVKDIRGTSDQGLADCDLWGLPLAESRALAGPRRKSIKQKTLRTIALTSFALVVMLAAARQAQAQDAKTPYPSMAALDQYLMERKAEIKLARSAAPESISQDADVMVLGRHGYETVVKGKNGFVCVVQRS